MSNQQSSSLLLKILRRCFVLVVALLSIALPGGSPASAEDITTSISGDAQAKISAALEGARFTVQTLTLQNQNRWAETAEVQFAAAGKEYTVQLALAQVRAPGFAVHMVEENGALKPGPLLARSAYTVLSATDALGQPSPASGTLAAHERGVLGTITIAGVKYTLQDPRSVFSDPQENLPQAATIVVDSASTKPLKLGCGNDDAEGHSHDEEFTPPPGQGNASSVTTTRTATIAFVVDGCYLTQLAYGSVPFAVQEIEASLAEVNHIFAPLTGISHLISGIVFLPPSNTCSPASDTSNARLSWFGSYWQSNYQGLFPGVTEVQLLTGRPWSDSNVGGRANLGNAFYPSLCSSGRKYSVARADYSFDMVVIIMAHELGHNWGVDHCTQGATNCSLMAPRPGSSDNQFFPPDAAAIDSYLNLWQPSCVRASSGTSPVPFFDDFNAQPINSARWGTAVSVRAETAPGSANGLVRFGCVTGSCNQPYLAALETLPLDMGTTLPKDKYLSVRFRLSTEVTTTNTVNFNVVGYNDIGQRIVLASIPASQLEQGSGKIISYDFRMENWQLHQNNFRIRFEAELTSQTDSIYLDYVQIFLDPYLQTDSYAFGASILATGDIDQDGRDEIIVTEPRRSSNSSYVAVHLAGATASPVVLPAAPSIRGGTSAAVLGDLNGDGYRELVVAYAGLSPAFPQPGVVRIFDGRSVAQRQPTQIAVHSGVGSTDALGSAVVSIRDIDGDGISDYAIGGSGINNRGGISFYSGYSQTLIPHATFFGNSDGDKFGCSMVNLGDVGYGGGHDAIAVGMCAPENSGNLRYVKIIRTKDVATGGPSVAYQIDAARISWPGQSGDTLFGYSLAKMVRAAAYPGGPEIVFLAVGAPGPRRSCASTSCPIVAGGSVFLTSVNFANPLPIEMILPGASGDDEYFGSSIAGVGHEREAHMEDLVVGAYGSNRNGPRSGRVAAYYFDDTTLQPNVLLEQVGTNSSSWFGYSVQAARLGTNTPDIIVGTASPYCGPLNCQSAAKRLSFTASRGTDVTSWENIAFSATTPKIKQPLLQGFGAGRIGGYDALTLLWRPVAAMVPSMTVEILVVGTSLIVRDPLNYTYQVPAIVQPFATRVFPYRNTADRGVGLPIPRNFVNPGVTTFFQIWQIGLGSGGMLQARASNIIARKF